MVHFYLFGLHKLPIFVVRYSLANITWQRTTSVNFLGIRTPPPTHTHRTKPHVGTTPHNNKKSCLIDVSRAFYEACKRMFWNPVWIQSKLGICWTCLLEVIYQFWSKQLHWKYSLSQESPEHHSRSYRGSSWFWTGGIGDFRTKGWLNTHRGSSLPILISLVSLIILSVSTASSKESKRMFLILGWSQWCFWNRDFSRQTYRIPWTSWKSPASLKVHRFQGFPRASSKES